MTEIRRVLDTQELHDEDVLQAKLKAQAEIDIKWEPLQKASERLIKEREECNCGLLSCWGCLSKEIDRTEPIWSRLRESQSRHESIRLIQEWEELTEDTNNWNKMETWLQKQSANLLRFAEIRKELAEEVNKNLLNTRTYEREGVLRGELIKIGEFPVYHTVWDSYPEGPTPWGTLWYHQKDRDSEEELNIMSKDGWVDGFDVLECNDPESDENMTYEDIKKALEEYDKKDQS